MLALSLTAARGQVERVLAIGSHADDIEIGCGATLLALTRSGHSMSRGSSSPRQALEQTRRVRAPTRSSPMPRTPTSEYWFRESFLPYDGKVKDVRGPERRRPTSSSRTPVRPSPGSPTCLRAHVEHVSLI